jgi:phage terminase large subunit-like protein
MGAGILIYMLVKHGVRGAQLFCAAVTKEQAKLAFADCEKMVKSSPHLRALVDQKVNNLAVLETGSFIRPISSEKRGLDGKRVQGAVIDELHEHPSAVVVAKVRAGIKGRPNALIFIPTNSGFDRESVCWEYHEYSRQVLEGTIANEQWFAFVCHLDACEACRANGHLQPNDECPDCDDWKIEGPHWLKANPNLGVSLPWDYLREQVTEALNLPSQRNMVRRLNFCQWTEQATVWIPVEQWAMCRNPELTEASLAGRECYIGVDLSAKIDLSSVVLVFPRTLGKVVEVGQPLTCAVDILSYFWMPKNTLHRRAEEDGVPYPDWEKQKHLTATAGDLVDHDVIAEFVIEVSERYKVRGIGVDQAGATAFITRMQRQFGDDMAVEVGQSFRVLSEPSKTLEALVVTGNLAHTGNPVMTMCISHMGKEENKWQEIRPVKMHHRKRIDGGVACIDALKMMQAMEWAPEPQHQVMVFGGRRR